MKVAVIGSGGQVGSRLVAELLRRGHSVTGIERNPKTDAIAKGLEIKRGDATELSTLAGLLLGNDAVISASRFETSNADTLIAATKTACIDRLLVVGGAASLEVAPGKALLDAPLFPDAYRAEASAGVRFLATLRKEKVLEWTFLSPSAEFGPGERTEKFRLGGDALLRDEGGRSWISMEDFSIAMIDELEHPTHIRQRFTVGY